jgi:adenine-specific DNA-methyltransferase
MIAPLKQELPSHFADRLGRVYAASVSQQHKKDNGQFFTPLEIAHFMASYSECGGEAIRILDPGCGSGILSCALVEHVIRANSKIRSIELVVYETDVAIFPILKQSLAYLNQWGEAQGIQMAICLQTEDFILHNADGFKTDFDLFAKPVTNFDIIISNPPYFKLPIDDKRALAAKVVVNGHPNIYAIFMALAAKLLKERGELIFITPRSYASGGYFKVFRDYFFKLVDLDKVHLFVSRKETFSRDKVLQETVVIKGTKRSVPSAEVVVSSSSGLKDLKTPLVKTFPKKDIINLSSREKILYLPTTNYEEAILSVFKKWTGCLSDYNIKISTGPVVAFRAREYLREEDGDSVAPLFWLHNVKQMMLEWPVPKPNKEQFIRIEEKSFSLLIPNKNYILLRRFSSKDDKSRLVAAPYFCDGVETDYIGVENKLNYIYRPCGYLEENEVIGVCALLNSRLFDAYFRIFNGNVNVSATELREMPLPPLAIIQEIGDAMILSDDYSVANANQIVGSYFEPALAHEQN